MTEDRVKEKNIFIELLFNRKGAKGSDNKGRKEELPIRQGETKGK